MEKKLRLIISLLVILGLTFIVYKLFMINKFSAERVSIDKQSIFSETINIKCNKCNVDNNKTYEDMLYHDYFSDYVKKSNSDIKVKYDSKGKVSSFYSISKEKQYIYLLNINSFELYSKKTYETDVEMQEYLDDRDIKNDVDLLRYVKDKYYLRNNIFTSNNTMKNNYIINKFVAITLPEFESITLIKGKLNGYIINTKNNIRSIHLLNKEDQYVITLSGDDITSDIFIKNLLNSISFK